MRTTALVLLLLLAGCGAKYQPPKADPRTIAYGWQVCVEDNSMSCSECNLSKDEARELAMAHVAVHSTTDDELYYYSACVVMDYGHGPVTQARWPDANYPEER